jgi:predicted amidophosphoribosyltransferase
VVAQFKFQQDDQFARILAKSSLINQQEKRVLELENDREMLREQLVHLQVDLQGQCVN